MERAQAGLFRQRLDGQVFAGMGLDQILDPLATPGVERAAGTGTDADSCASRGNGNRSGVGLLHAAALRAAVPTGGRRSKPSAPCSLSALRARSSLPDQNTQDSLVKSVR